MANILMEQNVGGSVTCSLKQFEVFHFLWYERSLSISSF